MSETHAQGAIDFILASGSPRRKELLARIGLDPRVFPVDVDETFQTGVAVGTEASRLATLKAETAQQRYGSTTSTGCLVLAADTIVAFDGTLLAKPSCEEEAMEMLSSLQGRSHQVVTGCALVSDLLGVREVFNVETTVCFKPCTQNELRGYCATGEPYDKAGGYGIQGVGSFLVQEIRGSYTNVVGLPLAEICDALQALGIWNPTMLCP